MKTYQQNHVSRGLCRCCPQPAKPGYTRCEKCLKKARDYQAKYDRQIGRTWPGKRRGLISAERMAEILK